MENAMGTASNNMSYIGTGAVGGYVGAWLQAKYNGVSGVDPMGRYQIESLVAGGVGAYLWLLVRGPYNVDTDAIWKALLVGWGAEWIYQKFVRGLLTEMNVVP
jgi:uncharacterized membrane protein YeaQ/YmgE (transglycosylase-associated protein family)